MKLSQWKYYGSRNKCYWLRVLMFGEGSDERAVLDMTLDANYNYQKAVDLSAISLVAQVGGDALFQFHATFFSAGVSIAIWSV